MLELKFRVWDTVMSLWVPRWHLKDFLKIKALRKSGYFSIQYFDMKSDRYVVMQYTNMNDMHGKEIYDGDIILENSDNDDVIGRVLFQNGCFCVNYGKRGSYTLAERPSNTYKIKGEPLVRKTSRSEMSCTRTHDAGTHYYNYKSTVSILTKG